MTSLCFFCQQKSVITVLRMTVHITLRMVYYRNNSLSLIIIFYLYNNSHRTLPSNPHHAPVPLIFMTAINSYSWYARHPLRNLMQAVSIVLPPLKNNDQLFFGVPKKLALHSFTPVYLPHWKDAIWLVKAQKVIYDFFKSRTPSYFLKVILHDKS